MSLIASNLSLTGRIPTQIGLRLFVDGLLEIGDISSVERHSIEKRPEEDQDSGELKHVEFINLDVNQALVVLVYMDGRVENRLMRRPEGLLPASLERAGNFLSARLKGRKLDEAREVIFAEIEAGKVEIDKAAQNLIKQGLASWGGEADKTSRQFVKRSLIVRGRAQLLDNFEAQSDLEKIRYFLYPALVS